MEEEKLEKWVEEAIELLPPLFRSKMQNVAIVVQDFPPRELSKRYPRQPPLVVLGLYQGIPLTKRRIYHSCVLPDKITIFRRPIESVCSSEKEQKKVVIRTVLHEIGHYFGLSEKDLREISLPS